MLLRLTFLETRPDLFLGHFSKHHYLKLRLKLLYIEQLVNWQHTGVPQVSSPAGHMTRVGRNGLISESTCVNTVKDTFVIQMDKQSSIGHAASPGAWYSHTGISLMYTPGRGRMLSAFLGAPRTFHVRMDRCLYCTGSSLHRLSHTFSGNSILWAGWDETG